MTYSLLRSKTAWTIFFMAVIGAGNAVLPFIPADYAASIQSVLAILALYFHNSTAQTAGATN